MSVWRCTGCTEYSDYINDKIHVQINKFWQKYLSINVNASILTKCALWIGLRVLKIGINLFGRCAEKQSYLPWNTARKF